MRIVISSEAEKSSLQTDKGRAKVERGSIEALFSRDDDTGETVFSTNARPTPSRCARLPLPKEGARMVNDVPYPLVPSHKSLVTSHHSLPNP